MKFRWTEEEKRENWVKQKKKGKNSFIWRVGVLRWGIPMFFFMTAYSQFFTTNPDLFTNVLFGIVMWPIGGVFFGLWVWTRLEKKYG